MMEKENSTIMSFKELENDYKLILFLTRRINQVLVENKVDQIIDLLIKRQELISKVSSFYGELCKLQGINSEQKKLNHTNIDEVELLQNSIRKILLEIIEIDKTNVEYGTQIKEAIKLELSRLRSVTRSRKEYIKIYSNPNGPRIIDENK